MEMAFRYLVSMPYESCEASLRFLVECGGVRGDLGVFDFMKGSGGIEERGTREEEGGSRAGGVGSAVEVEEGWLRNVATETTGEGESHVALSVGHMAGSLGHLAGGGGNQHGSQQEAVYS